MIELWPDFPPATLAAVPVTVVNAWYPQPRADGIDHYTHVLVDAPGGRAVVCVADLMAGANGQYALPHRLIPVAEAPHA